MANFLFWNTNRNDLIGLIAQACSEHDIDVLILAELKSGTPMLVQELLNKTQRIYFAPFDPSATLTFLTRYPPDSLKPVYDEGGIAVRHLRPPIGIELLVFAFHLPSKLYRSETEQTLNAARISKTISDLENRIGHSNSLIIGDLNMDPFEDGMVAADGFHAVMDRSIASKISRTVDGKHRKFFYNPMWGRYGDDTTGPPSTYYYSGGGQISRFWHMFDQVLLRPSLLAYYDSRALEIITKIGERSLLRNGRIDTSISDHLPLFLKLDVERGA